MRARSPSLLPERARQKKWPSEVLMMVLYIIVRPMGSTKTSGKGNSTESAIPEINDQRIINVSRKDWEKLQLRQQFDQNRVQQRTSEIMTNVIIRQVVRITSKNARQAFGKMQAVRGWPSIEPNLKNTKNAKRRH